MKKLLLSLTALSLALSITAQKDCVSETGWADNFTSADVPGESPLNIIYWGDTSIYKQTRSGNGALELSVTQAQDGWTPIGFDLGEGTSYVDISAENSVSVSLTNNGPSGVEVYFGFISGRTTGANANSASGNTLGEPFGGIIAAGETANWTFDLAGAKKRTWVANEGACDALGGTFIGSSCMTDVGFDASELSTGEFSINGQGASVDNAWVQPAITNHAVSVDFIKGGANCDVSVADIATSDLSVYPNPATDVVNVAVGSDNANVTLSDVTGSVVASATGSGTIALSTANVPAGLYVVSVSSAAGVTTSKVVVK